MRRHIVNVGRHWTKVAEIWFVLYYEWWHTVPYAQGKEERAGAGLACIQGVPVAFDPCDIFRNNNVNVESSFFFGRITGLRTTINS